jgi:hypothetical protein
MSGFFTCAPAGVTVQRIYRRNVHIGQRSRAESAHGSVETARRTAHL